ncbi:hypothetical protein OC845_005577 [Tilletia horrida]|nr:hypothetical protein OC845_005577 [Tilletia horrida]
MKQSLLSFAPRSQIKDLPTSTESSSESTALPPAPADVPTPSPAEISTPAPSQKPTASKDAGTETVGKPAKAASKTSKKAQPKSSKKPPASAFFQPIGARKDATAAEQDHKDAATVTESAVTEVDEESDAEAVVPVMTRRTRRNPAASVIVIHDDHDDDDDDDDVVIKEVKSAASSQEIKKQSPVKAKPPPASSSFTVKGTGPSNRIFKPFAKRPSDILKHVPWPKGDHVHVQPAEASESLSPFTRIREARARPEASKHEEVPLEPFDFRQALQVRVRDRSDCFLTTPDERHFAFTSTSSTLEAALSALAALAQAHGLEQHTFPGKHIVDSALVHSYDCASKTLKTSPAGDAAAQGQDAYQLWTHTHRPQRAAHVLGKRNRESAAFLRDWLHELVITEPFTTSAAGTSNRETSKLSLSFSSSKGGKGLMKGQQKKRKAGPSATDPSRRKIQRKVDKKGEREKKAKAARRARRGWSELDNSDEDDILDFIVDDELDVVYESEDDEILDWDSQSQSSHPRAGTPGDVPSSSLPEVTKLAPSTPSKKEETASRPSTPPSSSPVIGPGRARSNRVADPTTPTKNRLSTAPLAHPSPRKRDTFKDHLTNCILLEGPTGVGKTAAVYACASELGYEVFELFPGMGRRTGKDMEAAVGALAANHMVSGGGSGGGAKQQSAQQQRKSGKPPERMSDISAMFGAQKGKSKEHAEDMAAEAGVVESTRSLLPGKVQASAQEASTLSGGSDSVRVPASPKGPKAVRQSLILIEEADILYEDDRGFWPAMVELIGKSRRPVVITCNDLSSIPIADLPLQTTLRFISASVDEAVPYLQLVALQEGHILSPKDTARIYESTTSSLKLEASLWLAGLSSSGLVHASAPSSLYGIEKSCSVGSAVQALDLRQALLEMQFWCSTPTVAGGETAKWYATSLRSADHHAKARGESRPDEVDLATIGKVLDALSYADATLRPPFVDMIETHEPDAYNERIASATSLRDQLLNEEAHMLLKQGRKDEEQELADCGVQLASELQDACSKLCAETWTSANTGSDQQSTFERRVRYTQALSKLVDDQEGRSVVTNPSYILMPDSLVVDYAPYLRAMVQVDDAEAAQHAEAVRNVKAAAALSAEEGMMNPLTQLKLTRKTKNSQQSVLFAYGLDHGEELPRHIWSSETVLAAIREGAFPKGEDDLVGVEDRAGPLQLADTTVTSEGGGTGGMSLSC